MSIRCKAIILICLTAWGMDAVGQTVNNPLPILRGAPSVIAKDANLKAYQGLAIPVMHDTSVALTFGWDSLGMIIQIRSTGAQYKRDTLLGGGHFWNPIGAGGSADTTSLSNRINQKYGSADTGYGHPVATPQLAAKKIDSLQAVLSALIAAKFGLTDTGYAHTIASVYLLQKTIDSMKAVNAGLYRLKSDTVGQTSTTTNGHLYKAIDSALIAAGAYNPAADSGYGHIIATPQLVAKKTDSIEAVLSALIALKLSISDSVGTNAYATFDRVHKVSDSLAALFFRKSDTGYTKTLASVFTLRKVVDSLGALIGASGLTGFTTFGSTPNSNGASVSGANIILQPADATHPGGVSTGTQSIGGNKTFNNPIVTGASNLAVGGWLYSHKLYTDGSAALVPKDSGNKYMAIYNGNPLNYSQSVNYRQAVALLYNSLKNATIDTTTQGIPVFSDDFSRGSVGSAYTVADPGMTVSITSAGLELSAVSAPANYLNFVTRSDSFGWTCAEKARIHFKYYNVSLSSTAYGPMVGFHSQNANGYPHTVLAAVQQYTGAANAGKAVLVGGDTQGYSAFASSGMGTISVGDTIDITLTRDGLVYTINAIDLNTAGTSSIVVPANQDGTPFPANNTSTICVNFLGGDIVVTQLDYTLLVPYGPENLGLGNSILWGQGSGTTSSQAARFFNMAFAQSENVAVLAGGADYTGQFVNLLPEIRRINPKHVIMCPLAGNDILFGISTGTWQANLQTIRDGVVAMGIPVIWFTDPPRNDVSTLPIRTFIVGNSDFTSDQQILSSYDSLVDASGTTLQSSYSGGGDGVHENPSGHQKLGDLLSSALPIQTGLGRIKLPIPYGTGGGGGGYTLPAATTSVRGGVRADGTTTTMSGDVISAVGGAPGGASSSIQFNDGPFNGFGLYDKINSFLSIGANSTTPYADLSIDHNHAGVTQFNLVNSNGAGIPFLQIAGDGAGGLIFGRRNTSAGDLGLWLAGSDALATSDASDFLIENTTAHDIFFGTNGSEKMRIKNSGVVQFNTYGVGTHTGTLAYLGGYTSSGDHIEVDPSTIGGGTGGVYKPTITNLSNAGSITSDSAVWANTANIVSVDGSFNLSPTSGSTNTQVHITIPVTSNMNGAHSCWGTSSTSQTANGGIPGVIASSGAGTGTVTLTFYPTGQTTNVQIYYHFGYHATN